MFIAGVEKPFTSSTYRGQFSVMWFHLDTTGVRKGCLAVCPENRRAINIARVLPSLQAVFQVTKDQPNVSFPVYN